MKKFKILFVLNQARIAGTERHVLMLLKYINKSIFDVAVLCFSNGPLIDLLREKGIKVWTLERGKKFDFKISKKLFNLLKENKFDLIHSHSGQFACNLGRMAKVPYIIETRHGLVFNYDDLNNIGLIEFLINRSKASIVDLTLTVAEIDKKILNEKFGVPLKRIRSIPNGVDIKGIQNHKIDPEIIKQKLNIDPDFYIVGSVARFTEQKGLKYFIQSIKYIKTEIPNTKFIIVGDGELRDYLINLAIQIGVFEDLIFTGYRDDVISLMSIFNIFVLPSLWEGMPYSILEAMALKLPVVATGVFGNKETVIDGKTGFLVPPRDCFALAEAIIKLLLNKDKALKMGANGFNRIEKLFSAKKMTEKIEQIYLELVNKLI